ncbi:hypothetical protein A3H77_01545 [Candidatus Kaiserbacteria bacterium RIFCSPLOWO2_02_FULL_56_11]|uniref:DUF5668 domain-containing protein n=2 Tax=Candidatus Kaiseribacteriota TaxID=1752734 RepID=A0A1F6E3C4_9BACT|nr:MAG: hypothetical protein A3C95_00540 [Candidatus Kaiserbacteria bacterium RIFCSPHIGHO2_02_FULL_56_30]OGG71872.1 MAG: hypothetical protein A3E65_00430 [Candidatus Kaiserbacteria bacterium RIFCSPHIGHO2_12_FULL_56_13]OGG81547.1 MAG: hypothetical protein A3H77_01545 [Candidatus Kaiserbacteria bacterium RIFCSPLOWO2_02_FULL_56_11]
MSRSGILILVGLLTILAGFVGLPLAWLRVLLPIFGAIVIAIGFMMRTERIAALKREMPAPPNDPSSAA